MTAGHPGFNGHVGVGSYLGFSGDEEAIVAPRTRYDRMRGLLEFATYLKPGEGSEPAHTRRGGAQPPPYALRRLP